MDARRHHHYYKKLDYAQQKQNVSFANGPLWYFDTIENKNGLNNAQILNVNQEILKSKTRIQIRPAIF